MAYTCNMCAGALMVSFALLLNHLQRVHAQDPNFHVACGIDGCGCTYKTFYGYRSHVQRKHRAFYENSRKIRDGGTQSEQENEANEPRNCPNETDAEWHEEDDEVIPDPIKRNNAALYVLRVKETYNLTQKAVNDVINNTTYLVREAVTNVCGAITKELKKITGTDFSAQISVLSDESSSVANPFRGMETITAQTATFKELFGLVVSILISVAK